VGVGAASNHRKLAPDLGVRICAALNHANSVTSDRDMKPIFSVDFFKSRRKIAQLDEMCYQKLSL